MLFQIVVYLPVLSNNCNNIFLQCEAPVYTPVVLAEEQPYITKFRSGIINLEKINIRVIKLRCISAARIWSHINNTVALTILTFWHIQCLHLMYAEAVWVLVSLGTQVQLQIILDPDYLPDDLSVSYDYDMLNKCQLFIYDCSKYFMFNAIFDGKVILFKNIFVIGVLANRHEITFSRI